MLKEVVVVFTETITRTFVFEVEVDEDQLDGIQPSDVQWMLDEQQAWDQPVVGDWLEGAVVNRTIDHFEFVDQ